MLARSRSRKVVALARQIRDLAHDGPRAVSDSCAENQPGEAAIDESSTQEEQWLTAGRWVYHLANRGYLLASVDNICKLLVLFARDYAQRKTTAKELTDHLVFTLDYVEQKNPQVGKQTTFKGVLRKQAEWHRKLAHDNRQRQRKELTELYTWQPLVQRLELRDMKATSLNSSDELLEEGAAMGHCVGGYFQACYTNHCRIFSLTMAGQRVSTLELTWIGTSWTQGQLYGPGNCKVRDKQVIQLARRVVAACNKAPALDASLNTVTQLKVRKPAKPTQSFDDLTEGMAEDLIPF